MSENSILVLTTREKDWWWSLQEVIPAIENVWTRLSATRDETIHIAALPLSAEDEALIAATRWARVVITVTTSDTVRIALDLRERLGAAAQFILYVSGDSTEGFHAFGDLAGAVTERDLLIVSSEAEGAATRLCFPRARVAVLPFPLVDQFELTGNPARMALSRPRLVYVGRVSEQKNLHTLLVALWLLRKHLGPTVTLEICGRVDNLGSPNMALSFAGYDHYLEKLCADLELEDAVTWHGFKDRGWLLSHVHSAPHILVTASLHSDENFGASMLASLANGYPVVATAWGGHLSFEPWFTTQLTLVRINGTPLGPAIDPGALAAGLCQAVGHGGTLDADQHALLQARTAFSEADVARRTGMLLDAPIQAPQRLQKSLLLEHIDAARRGFGNARRIYEGYHDPLAQPFFAAFGMGDARAFDLAKHYMLPPWVRVTGKTVEITDPHRGNQRLPIAADGKQIVRMQLCPSSYVCHLPRSTAETLVRWGYAFEATALTPDA